MSFFNPSAETEKITKFLHDSAGSRPVVLGLSGGIDSSVVLKLCTLSFPAEQIHTFFLPEKGTPESDFKDIDLLLEGTGLKCRTIPIDGILDSYSAIIGKPDAASLGNLKSRIRMTLLYFYSNSLNGLVLGTTNRSEYMTGYFTKFGDGACDVEPIMHLYKTQVKEIALHLHLPDSIIRKPPTAGLWPDQTDERELGLSYAELDSILDRLDRGVEVSDEKLVTVNRLISGSEHKRNPPISLEFRGN